ncbi:hypothetical protein CPC08DRAFT_802011, partial [Agrocybe pediades]
YRPSQYSFLRSPQPIPSFVLSFSTRSIHIIIIAMFSMNIFNTIVLALAAFATLAEAATPKATMLPHGDGGDSPQAFGRFSKHNSHKYYKHGRHGYDQRRNLDRRLKQFDIRHPLSDAGSTGTDGDSNALTVSVYMPTGTGASPPAMTEVMTNPSTGQEMGEVIVDRRDSPGY